MLPKQHQLDKSEQAWQHLLVNKYVLIQGKPRTGKTLTALLTVEKSKRIQNILVLTPKAAISGWNIFINDPELRINHISKNYTVTNYEALGRYVTRTISKSGTKLKKPIKEIQLKLNPDDYDLIILDESHRLGKLGKPSQRYELVSAMAQDKPTINLSGTAIVESPCSIYYQMSTSTHTPFPHKSFYDFFREWGQPSTIRIGNRDQAVYKLAQPKLLDYIQSFSVFINHDDAGIDQSSQSTDKLHYIPLDTQTKVWYNTIQSDRIIKLPGIGKLVCDTIMKLRTSLHMLEGGSLKIGDSYHSTGNLEKINYIKQQFGDTPDLGIMAHYIGERQLLESHFNHATIYSSTKHAEGVDLSHLHHFVIYSSGFSGAKFIQRNERIVNMSGSNTLTVHHLLAKDAISDQAYQMCSQKNDFNNATYQAKQL